MAAPEWYGSDRGPASVPIPAGLDEAVSQAAATQIVPGLLDLSADLLNRCGSFFDPVVLAQLDAALAHELAHQAQQQSVRATEEVDLAIRERRPSEPLAHLVHRSATATSAAAKSASQAALASTVVESLGGCVVGRTPVGAVGAVVVRPGFDPSVVDRVCGADLIDLIAGLEEAKNGIAAVQAQAQTLFVAQQRLDQARAGVPWEKIGKGIAQQVGLARHESPCRGRQITELSEVLVREMPRSMDAFSRGKLSEYRVGLIAKETAFLSLEHRAQVDQLICGDPDAVELLGSRELSASARKAAYKLDPQAFVKRHEKAVGDRYVSLRPAADGMTYLTALIPLKQGVRILSTLTKVADSLRTAGDERGKGQIMADALMHRLVQHAPCDEGNGTLSDHRGVPAGGFSAAPPAGVPTVGAASQRLCTTIDEANISLELVVTDRSLFGSDNEPAVLVGYDPIPAPIARNMILGTDGGGGGGGPSPQVWLKRLFTHPGSNQLLAMDSQARLFPEGIKEFLRIQDQRCQTPYCDAPIREYDHVKAYAAGGTTSIDNGQGLCSDCNKTKEAPGWSSVRDLGGGAVDADPAYDSASITEITTPTGHRYLSAAPPLPGPARRRRRWR